MLLEAMVEADTLADALVMVEALCEPDEDGAVCVDDLASLARVFLTDLFEARDRVAARDRAERRPRRPRKKRSS